MKFYHSIIWPIVLLVWIQSLSAQEPVCVVSGRSVANAKQPQVAVLEDGTIFVAFAAENTIYCCKKTDAKKSFDEPVKVGSLPKLALGMRRGPRIVASQDVIVITAISHESGDLMAWRSTDSGDSWQGPLRVNDSPKDSREGLHAMAMSTTGEIFCVWLDLRNRKTELFGAASTDGGKTFSENRLVYCSPGGSICECCHPAVAYDAKGNLYVMWRNSLGGCRDMYTAMSIDGGRTFDGGHKLGNGRWKLEACPMDGGYLAVSTPENLTTVWRRDRQIFRTDTDPQIEKSLGEGEQPWAAATPEGAYLVWLSRRGGDLWLATPNDDHKQKLSEGASDPVVAAPVTGIGPVVVVWEKGKNGDASIMAIEVHR